MSDAEKIIYSMYKVSKHYNRKAIITDISLSYFYGAKIGVLGLNGSGKSTLLRIMAGIDSEYEGTISIQPGFTVGFLGTRARVRKGQDGQGYRRRRRPRDRGFAARVRGH